MKNINNLESDQKIKVQDNNNAMAKMSSVSSLQQAKELFALTKVSQRDHMASIASSVHPSSR